MAFQRDEQGRIKVTLISGDGIGPEVTWAARQVIEAAGAKIAWQQCLAGANVFKACNPTGVPAETIASIEQTRVVLKGPLETPVGFGEKSANVTLRKLFETFANVRPVREIPGVKTPFSGRGLDLVVVRENVEDLYAGIEHMQSPGVAQCLKVMSRKGCEKVVRLAFELAVAEGRRSIHCATKANIMKLTEGLMKRTFEEVAREYPQVKTHHILIDNCAHQLVRNPEQFEVIVTSNMNGDIISDLTSGLIGGLGFAPGANLGKDIAIFEAVHGTAPSIAGQNLANPSAVILTAVMLLRHIGDFEVARRVEQALLATLASGAATGDVKTEGALSTSAFTERVIANLEQASHVTVRTVKPLRIHDTSADPAMVKATARRLAGLDVFIETSETPEVIGRALETMVEGTPMRLKMISNRGTQVFPLTGTATDCVDVFRCRFITRDDSTNLTDQQLWSLVGSIQNRFRWMHLEKLQVFDGVNGWTKAQGEGEVAGA